jgi:GNAT superfamily N-acetyltransferase
VDLAVAPGRQRRGTGSSLLLPVLGEAEAAGLSCYLETISGRSLAFNARIGFAVAGEEQGPGGLRIWAMVRPPH